MKNIYFAAINPNSDGTYNMGVISEAEYSFDWAGEVAAYLANLDMEEGCTIVESPENVTIYENFGAHRNIENVTYVYYNGEPVQVWFAADAPLWYAVMKDQNDDDWGTGSYNLAEAKAMARKYPEGYIAVIEIGIDEYHTCCIDEIHDLED